MTDGVLITGGAGFIGSHAAEALLSAGERVRVLDDFSTGRPENLAGISGALEVVEGDVRDPETVTAAMRGCDRVLHLAAIASVTRSFADPATTEAVNVGGTANVLAAARDGGARRVVLASSCAVYGATAALPVSEAAPTRPESPYARSKLAGEDLCRAACARDGLQAGVLRFFNVYGPRQDPSSDYSGVIAIFMERLSSGGTCTVYGDGRQTRDFVFVADVVAACRAALDARALDGAPVNVGTGVETSLRDVLAALATASGREPLVAFAPAREGDIRRSWAACDRAAELLGFRATTALTQGLAATWSWHAATRAAPPAVPAGDGAGRARVGGLSAAVASARQISVGGVAVGGGAPIVVQSMVNTPTGDAGATLEQVRALAAAGSELVRVSLPAAADTDAFAEIVRHAPVPIVADIHFDWRLALAALACGAAAVRINPGTIGSDAHVREIVQAAAEQGAAIRIGVNSGSLPRELRGLAQSRPSEALVEAALGYAARFEEWGFADYKLSVKSSSVPDTIAAYRALSQRTDAPLHVGVTEAGTVWSGTIKSAVGIGALLADGIGDTIRVSLTGDPVEEVRVAWAILAALELRRRGPNLISCPTCGRTEIDLVALADAVEERLRAYAAPISVAVMGCRVNGPEEARHADFGIAGGRGEGVVFAHGVKVAAVPEAELVGALFARIDAELGRAGKEGPGS